MQPQKITEQAEKIRALIIDDDLEQAFPLLMNLAKNADGNYWDESLNLNQDYTKLTNETRSGFLTPIQAETNRNRLIDKMLKLVRKIENNEGLAENSTANTATVSKTVEVKRTDSKNINKLLLGITGIVIFGIILFFVLQKDRSALPEQMTDNVEKDLCTETMEEGITAFKNGDFDRAERVFISAKDICDTPDKAQTWIERTEIQRQRNQPKNENNNRITTPPKKNTEREKPDNSNSTPIKKKENTPVPKQKTETAEPVKPEPPDDRPKRQSEYQDLMKKGNTAFKNKDYPQAYAYYTRAKTVYPEIDAQERIVLSGKLETVRDLCYRMYFTRGMDFYNAEEYRNAMTEFEKAQSYKDFSQVKGMIRRCKSELN